MLLTVSVLLQGCASDNPKGGIPVQPGDYAGGPKVLLESNQAIPTGRLQPTRTRLVALPSKVV